MGTAISEGLTRIRQQRRARVANWIEGKVVDKTEWTDELFSVRFEAPIEPFAAGQFTRIGLDIEGERVGRPYSLVNAPDEQPHEIYFNTVPEGPLSPRLATLNPGDSLWVGPKAGGLLTLDEVPADARDLWLMATGTALGPFLSILKSNAPWERFEHIVLIHAVRYGTDLNYPDVVEDLQQRHNDRLRFVPFISREPSSFALPGRIPLAISEGLLEKRVGLHLLPERSHVMLCGNSGMIQDTTAALGQRGLRRHLRREPGHISAEKYH